VVAPFWALAEPIVDMVRPMRYPKIYPLEGDDHTVASVCTMFTGVIDRRAAQTIVERLGSANAPMAVAQIRVLGGAMARVPPDSTAFAHRSSRVMVNVAAVYERPDEAAVHEPWVAGFAAALRQGDGGAYVNFLGDEVEARVRAAYPGKTWERLAVIKARYDPTNLFRLNQNIPPKPDVRTTE
jgi:berberine-like enzyme